MSGVLNVAEDVAKGASAGSIVPGIGTAIGAIGGLAMGIEPAIGQWLFGKNAPAVNAAVNQIATQVTGTADPERQAAALADTAVAAKMRVALAQLAAQQAEIGWQDQLNDMEARLKDVQGARAMEEQEVSAKSPLQWAAPMISVLVVLATSALIWLAFNHVIPAGSTSILDILIGSLMAGLHQVLNFWLGSSRDSQVKTHLLAARK